MSRVMSQSESPEVIQFCTYRLTSVWRFSLPSSQDESGPAKLLRRKNAWVERLFVGAAPHMEHFGSDISSGTRPQASQRSEYWSGAPQ